MVGQEVGLPAGVEQLLVEVVTDGFVLHCCGAKAAPNALVACYQWEHYLDHPTGPPRTLSRAHAQGARATASRQMPA
ncbi:MAG: hypothetical protein ACRDRY_24910 [Pseudonocardiaceae bacterium]